MKLNMKLNKCSLHLVLIWTSFLKQKTWFMTGRREVQRKGVISWFSGLIMHHHTRRVFLTTIPLLSLLTPPEGFMKPHQIFRHGVWKHNICVFWFFVSMQIGPCNCRVIPFHFNTNADYTSAYAPSTQLYITDPIS